MTVKIGDEFIEHFGVKGQKWGVRKKRSGAEQKRIDSRKKLAEKRRSLSDEDIKKAIDRISNEKRLKDLVNEDTAPGKTIAKRILGESGQKVAKTVLVGATMFAIKVAIDKKTGVKTLPGQSEASKFIAARPKTK